MLGTGTEGSPDVLLHAITGERHHNGDSSCDALLACSYWGEALKWGPQHKLDSAEACCQACQDYRPANDDDMDCNGKSAALNLLPSMYSCGILYARHVKAQSCLSQSRRNNVHQACKASLHKHLIKDAGIAHQKPGVPGIVLRRGCSAVWVYCGDKEKCLGSYKECWLKHLVSLLMAIASADHIRKFMSYHACLQRHD